MTRHTEISKELRRISKPSAWHCRVSNIIVTKVPTYLSSPALVLCKPARDANCRWVSTRRDTSWRIRTCNSIDKEFRRWDDTWAPPSPWPRRRTRGRHRKLSYQWPSWPRRKTNIQAGFLPRGQLRFGWGRIRWRSVFDRNDPRPLQKCTSPRARLPWREPLNGINTFHKSLGFDVMFNNIFLAKYHWKKWFLECPILKLKFPAIIELNWF